MAMQRPEMLMGVSWSWKMVVLRKMVATSLKMPATELCGPQRVGPEQSRPRRADAQGDDRGTLDEPGRPCQLLDSLNTHLRAHKLADGHAKGEDTGEEDQAKGLEGAADGAEEGVGAKDGARTLEDEAADAEDRGHDGREPEQGRDGVRKAHGLACVLAWALVKARGRPTGPTIEEELGEGPAEATHGRGGEDLEHADEVELGLGADHEDDTDGDEGDDADEAPGRTFETEEKGEEEDEAKGGGLAHGCAGRSSE
jgi:hypothetical protein